eukprot:TRINITY_DN5523_c0_g1_i2.p1 TRINITY_DN5523_c0_g1~~TRINITY_DN5523_c0_g1_i2.p1  ORF type:complete len:733 (+),score=122.90 TRINITY_DN5523_c0_g1_i2:42-2201(+)
MASPHGAGSPGQGSTGQGHGFSPGGNPLPSFFGSTDLTGSPSWAGQGGLSPSLDFAQLPSQLRQKQLQNTFTVAVPPSWSLPTGGAGLPGQGTGTNAGLTFYFEARPSMSEGVAQELYPSLPTGWQLGSGAATLAANRLRFLDKLHGESLLSLPLPQVLQRPWPQAVPAQVAAQPGARGGDPGLPKQAVSSSSSLPGGSPSPSFKELPASSLNSWPFNSEGVLGPLLSQVSGSQPQQSPQDLKQQEPLLESVQKSFQETWSVLVTSMEALSGNWCLAQSPSDIHGFSSHRGFLRPDYGPLDPCLDSMTWFVRTAPAAVAAEVGGTASPLVAMRMPLLHEAMEAGAMDEVPFGALDARGSISRKGAAPLQQQTMTQQEMHQILGATNASVVSLKGNKMTAPNQDRAMIGKLGLGAAEIFVVLDGHGEVGHDVAEVCIEVLPKLLLQRLNRSGSTSQGSPDRGAVSTQETSNASLDSVWKVGAVQAFEEMHCLLEALTAHVIAKGDMGLEAVLQSDLNSRGSGTPKVVDSRISGTTATVVVMTPDRRILLAHAGDSRAVFGVRRRRVSSLPWRVRDLTRDHKPDLPDEKSRIEIHGAQVVTIGNPPNTTCRVYSPQQGWPSINMSRSLGDLHAHSQGLSAEAEVNLLEKAWDPGEDAVLVVASDGIWDVIDSETAVIMAWQSSQQGADPAAFLAHEAYERWGRRGLQGGYTDDITVIVKML